MKKKDKKKKRRMGGDEVFFLLFDRPYFERYIISLFIICIDKVHIRAMVGSLVY